jgi:hypothetical protein
MSKKPITKPRSAEWYAGVKREAREAIARIRARDEAARVRRAAAKAAGIQTHTQQRQTPSERSSDNA